MWFQTQLWFVSGAVFYSNSDHFTVGAIAYSQYTALYIMYMGNMWRNQSVDQTTTLLSLFVNLLWQVKWVIPCLHSVNPVKKCFLVTDKGSACNPHIICHSTLSLVLIQTVHINFIQHSKFLLMAPRTLQNLKPVDNHHKCLKPWLLDSMV